MIYPHTVLIFKILFNKFDAPIKEVDEEVCETLSM